MKVMNIIHDSIVDGDGLRTVIFFAGCPHRCQGCHNPESWSEANGTIMTIEEIMKEIEANPLNDVTFSGGEPFNQADKVSQLAKRVKSLGKNLWIYSGYTYEELLATNSPAVLTLLEHCDVLVDGKFLIDERDLTLQFKGSKNQRIIKL